MKSLLSDGDQRARRCQEASHELHLSRVGLTLAEAAGRDAAGRRP